MKAVRVELKEANLFVTEHHRHHKPVVGHRRTKSEMGKAVAGTPTAATNAGSDMSEQALIKELKSLTERWPKGYWLFANGCGLYLCRNNPDGSRWVTRGGSVHPESIVATFNIPSDGGDF